MVSPWLGIFELRRAIFLSRNKEILKHVIFI